jgi:hypothetical protein
LAVRALLAVIEERSCERPFVFLVVADRRIDASNRAVGDRLSQKKWRLGWGGREPQLSQEMDET